MGNVIDNISASLGSAGADWEELGGGSQEEFLKTFWGFSLQRNLDEIVSPTGKNKRGDERPPEASAPSQGGANQFPLQDLPNDVKEIIFKYLSPIEIVMVCRVSKTWNKLKRLIFRSLCVRMCPFICKYEYPEEQDWNVQFNRMLKGITIFNKNFYLSPDKSLNCLLHHVLPQVPEGFSTSTDFLELMYSFAPFTIAREGRFHYIKEEHSLEAFLNLFPWRPELDLKGSLKMVTMKILPTGGASYKTFWKIFNKTYLTRNALECPKFDQLQFEKDSHNNTRAAEILRLLAPEDPRVNGRELLPLLPEYVATFDFSHIHIVPALYLFLTSFTLITESQLLEKLFFCLVCSVSPLSC
eukprot:TRINITY_DN2935_c0_g1_i3.p1 TRINITY_DN2935_c0_g1~~TRINITY_DN2935_c0_g1_i3.p1  ORF type:complete len:365 (+),score=77.44 TRINITY_DN2935_c0_g1_i3:32-1096(+)